MGDDGGANADIGDFESWVRSHWQQLRALARVVTGDPHLADDVLQDCLVDLYGRWAQLSADGGNPMGYAVRVMASKAANRRRTAWARRVVTTDDAEVFDGPTGDGTGSVDDRVAVVSALASLSPQQREIVAMHYLLDMPVAEIAQVMGKPVSSVTSDLTRARQRLRAGGDGDGG